MTLRADLANVKVVRRTLEIPYSHVGTGKMGVVHVRGALKDSHTKCIPSGEKLVVILMCRTMAQVCTVDANSLCVEAQEPVLIEYLPQPPRDGIRVVGQYGFRNLHVDIVCGECYLYTSEIKVLSMSGFRIHYHNGCNDCGLHIEYLCARNGKETIVYYNGKYMFRYDLKVSLLYVHDRFAIFGQDQYGKTKLLMFTASDQSVSGFTLTRLRKLDSIAERHPGMDCVEVLCGNRGWRVVLCTVEKGIPSFYEQPIYCDQHKVCDMWLKDEHGTVEVECECHSGRQTSHIDKHGDICY